MEHDARRPDADQVKSALHDLAAALASGGIETPPDGWLTTQQHAEAAGMSREHASTLIKRGIDAGLLEMRKFRIQSGGRVYPVPHYRRRA